MKEEIETIRRSPIAKLDGPLLDLIFSGKSLNVIYADYAEEFEKLAARLDQVVTNICDEMQKVISDQADELFGGKKRGNKKEEEKKEPQTLDEMMEGLTRGEKGQGRFNKLILQQYFKDSDIMDKRCMLASMIRFLKPKQAYMMTDEEAFEELKKDPSNASFRYVGYLDDLQNFQRAIVRSYADLHSRDEMAGALLGGMLKGAGPLLQKLMQGMSLGGAPKSMKLAIKDMKSNLLPIADEYVKVVMRSIVERSNKAIERIEVVRPLGAASVGQAFLCRIYGRKYSDGKDVVIKVLRPDAKNRMEREKVLLRRYAEETDKSGGMKETLEGQLEGYEKELDLSIESRNVDAGRIYENQEEEVTSMKLIHDVEAGQDFLMGEKAEGTTVDRYLEDIDKKIEELTAPFYKGGSHLELNDKNVHLFRKNSEELSAELKRLEKRRDHVCKLCSIWVKEGMINSGFYHADLHAGNIMVTDKKVTVIDYGNAVQISGGQQRWISAMLASAATGDAELFFESFDALLDKSDPEFVQFYDADKQEELKKGFLKILRMGDETEAGQRIMACFLKAQELGVKVPPAIYNFSQGQLRLMNTVEDMNTKIKKLQKAVLSMGNMNVRGDCYVNPQHLFARKVSDARRTARNYGDDDKHKTHWDALYARFAKKQDESGIMSLVKTNIKLDGLSEETAAQREAQIQRELAEMFAEQKDGMGKALKTAYDKLRDSEKIGAATEEQKNQAMDSFLESYKKVALYQLKLQYDLYYDPKKIRVRPNSFLKVMGDILKDPFLLIKTAWHVGGRLGYKIYKSDSRAKKARKAEKEAEERLKAAEERLKAENREPVLTKDDPLYDFYSEIAIHELKEERRKNGAADPDTVPEADIMKRCLEYMKAQTELDELAIGPQELYEISLGYIQVHGDNDKVPIPPTYQLAELKKMRKKKK